MSSGGMIQHRRNLQRGGGGGSSCSNAYKQAQGKERGSLNQGQECLIPRDRRKAEPWVQVLRDG